jgi:hypothetical protein
MDSEVFERWLPTYSERADTVAAALGELFQEAMTHWVFDKAGKSIDITKSREFLRQKRVEFPHRILFFTYSSQFDEAVESKILYSDAGRPQLSDSLTPREILSRKADLLEPNFKQLLHDAHVLADHYTVALSANERLRKLPLVWEVPAEAESETGFPPDYMWHATFYFLCEISQAIIAYGGYSSAFYDEFTYIQKEPALRARFLWLDQNGELFFPDRDQQTWPLSEIANVLSKIAI